jgi:hypothetical protein
LLTELYREKPLFTFNSTDRGAYEITLNGSSERAYCTSPDTSAVVPNWVCRLDNASISAGPFFAHLVTDKSLLVPTYLPSVLPDKGIPSSPRT